MGEKIGEMLVELWTWTLAQIWTGFLMEGLKILMVFFAFLYVLGWFFFIPQYPLPGGFGDPG